RCLHRVGRRSGATLFITPYATFSTLLSKYSGREDMVIGSPIANRNHKQLVHLNGFLVNTLALGVDASGDPPFTSLLVRVKMLDDIAGSPGERISELSILTEAERRRLVATFSDADADYSRDKCIHHLVEEVVENQKEPDASTADVEFHRAGRPHSSPRRRSTDQPISRGVKSWRSHSSAA
ncbi:MAG: hypothetical protein GY859_37535, partial [Desulfobacterales bacterium]|nr:hypothetical protein [Desulfobacterales bacterium]